MGFICPLDCGAVHEHRNNNGENGNDSNFARQHSIHYFRRTVVRLLCARFPIASAAVKCRRQNNYRAKFIL